jgi:hypothetical protein
MTEMERMVELLDIAGVRYTIGEGENNESYIDLPGGTRLYYNESGTLIEAI